jgi:hypothetical protein
MRDTARYARQADRELNPNFRRPWSERPQTQHRPLPAHPPAPGGGTDPEQAAMATLLKWRDDWRARRAVRPSRRATAL